jgi:predicted RND superfamily exporter protein
VLPLKIIELENKMLAELLRLSKELYELEMIEESTSIDDMIHKLYGTAIGPVSSSEYEDSEDSEEFCPASGFDNFRKEFHANTTKELFKDELASIIYESFDSDDVETIRDLLTNYIEVE